MAHELIVAMHVKDAAGYQRYRDAMRPILERYGGGFRHDFVVSEALRTDAAHPVTRIFAIYFRDRAAKDAFFADPEYLQVKAAHLEESVGGSTIVAAHDRD